MQTDFFSCRLICTIYYKVRRKKCIEEIKHIRFNSNIRKKYGKLMKYNARIQIPQHFYIVSKVTQVLSKALTKQV